MGPRTGALSVVGGGLGRPPPVHRTSHFIASSGVFRRTMPCGGSAGYHESPFPYTKVPQMPYQFADWTWHEKKQILTLMAIIFLYAIFWAFVGRYDVTGWARQEALRRRRERRERQEMDILGVNEDDVDPKLVEEVDRLYIKGRSFA
eukprot:Hpha_TRINITY_DN14804_c0_g6::TRINITY_DN14804_c0_g6_i1::g.169380::m.169380